MAEEKNYLKTTSDLESSVDRNQWNNYAPHQIENYPTHPTNFKKKHDGNQTVAESKNLSYNNSFGNFFAAKSQASRISSQTRTTTLSKALTPRNMHQAARRIALQMFWRQRPAMGDSASILEVADRLTCRWKKVKILRVSAISGISIPIVLAGARLEQIWWISLITRARTIPTIGQTSVG
jgi:hypothetical protein